MQRVGVCVCVRERESERGGGGGGGVTLWRGGGEEADERPERVCDALRREVARTCSRGLEERLGEFVRQRVLAERCKRPQQVRRRLRVKRAAQEHAALEERAQEGRGRLHFERRERPNHIRDSLRRELVAALDSL